MGNNGLIDICSFCKISIGMISDQQVIPLKLRYFPVSGEKEDGTMLRTNRICAKKWPQS